MLLLQKDPLRRYQNAAVLKGHLTQQWTTETGFVPYDMIRREARRRLRLPMVVLALMAPLFVALGVAGYLTATTLWAGYQAGRSEDRAAVAYRKGDWPAAIESFRQAIEQDRSPQRELFLRRAEGQQRLAVGLSKLEKGQI